MVLNPRDNPSRNCGCPSARRLAQSTPRDGPSKYGQGHPLFDRGHGFLRGQVRPHHLDQPLRIDPGKSGQLGVSGQDDRCGFGQI
jgi:hypothetical protein